MLFSAIKSIENITKNAIQIYREGGHTVASDRF